MVHIVTINIPGSTFKRIITDKYLKQTEKCILKKASSLKVCQIGKENFITKKERLRSSNRKFYPVICPTYFYQTTKDFSSLAFSSKLKKFRKILNNGKNTTKYNSLIFIKLSFRPEFIKVWDNSWQILRAGDVERNPGPSGNQDSLIEIAIITYNARGLKDKLKLKRILNKFHNLIKTNPNYIFMIQETHLDDKECEGLKFLWRNGYSVSPGVGRQRGTMILYDNSWEVLHTDRDDEGRICIIGLKKYDHHFCITNVYAPNDHDIAFFTNVYDRLYDHQLNYPNAKFILGGDFNLVLSKIDSVNRGSNNAEKRSRKFILEQNELLSLVDSYRVNNRQGGFTWSRSNCMSRLDLILVSKDLINLGISSEVNWGFDISDHALVEIKVKIRNTVVKGKGLYRVNTSVLEQQSTLEEVKSELTFQLSSIPNTWNPHKKLEYVKMTLRSVLSLISGRKRKRDSDEQNALKDQLNTLKLAKEKLLLNNSTNSNLLTQIDNTFLTLELDLKKYLDEKAKYLILRSGAKWYEEGERSNAYFLNIINKRNEQTQITKLESTNGVVTSQAAIMDHIVNFYSDLYSSKDTNENYDALLSDLPKLSEEERTNLDSKITLKELEVTLRSCSETAPGPDGIPYSVYKSLWQQLGPYLLDAWEYSKRVGILPEDQRVSCITLLPKTGKNIEKIENWRPITLTNCDLKIFTKLISNRVSKVLDKVISPAQTAYIPGRVVHDNLRIFDFYKNYCQTNNVDSLLISLDAKKAFDSVSHKYLHEVLRRYGFSDDFIETVKLLYRDIKANIMVNGYKSVMIQIARSVKQGDALSCALFILCIDPLLRQLERNTEIESITVGRSRFSNININSKVGAFADDVGMAVKNNATTVRAIFEDYATFSGMSGIELNIEKTEVLQLNVNSSAGIFVPKSIRVGGKVLKTTETIKICGVTFSCNDTVAYKNNITDKITKLEKQIIRWLPRYLSLEGKLLIVKTFGLSQLIYSLQMCEIKETDTKKIESIIFRFLWNNKWNGSIAPDRIKRSFLKSSYERGGLNVPDIQILDKALKTKQFLRAMNSNHHINLVQKHKLEALGYFEYYKNEYHKICSNDIVISTYQQTVNIITDKIRTNGVNLEYEALNQLRANLIASIDVIEYFRRKRIPLVIHRFKTLADAGIETFHELINELNYPRSDRHRQCASEVISFFPTEWVNLVHSTIDIDSGVTYEIVFPTHKGKTIVTKKISVKSIRTLLRDNMPKLQLPYDNETKFELTLNNLQHNPFLLVRNALHCPRDRFYKYRILHGDIFCNSRMFKFKMKDNPNCNMCPDIVENIKHLIWDCPRSARVWNFLNNLTKDLLGGEYITYNTVILGNTKPLMAMETIIVWALKLITTIDRDSFISNEVITQKLSNLLHYERKTFSTNSKKLLKRWGNLIHLKVKEQ